jgi:hypothetical protein
MEIGSKFGETVNSDKTIESGEDNVLDGLDRPIPNFV